MFKTRFISMLVLLMVAVTGAVAQSTYKVSVKEGTEDAEKWTIEPTEAAAGTQVTVTYSGLKKAAAPAEEPVTPQNTEGNLVHLTVNVGASTGSATNGSRAKVNPSTGVISFSNGDKLYVGYDNACVGTLEYSATTNKFSGDLSLSQNGDQPLHFYYLGGYGEYVNQVDETQYIVDIYEQQFNPYPVISYGTSTTNYSESNNAYTTTLENQCALVEFTTNRILKELDFYIRGINNQVAIDFENNTITTTNTIGSISLYPESPTSRWAILLPNEEPVTVTVDAVGYDKIDITIPPVKKNDFLHGENAVRFELTAMEADEPLTMTAAPGTNGYISVINPPEGMKYSKNNGEKIPIESDINIPVIGTLEHLDMVQFYGNSKNYSNTRIVSTDNMSLSGNIMSLVDEENFATITTMVGTSFAGLFAGNTCGFEASGLLLPATTLSENCYSGMFAGCSNMSDTPVELPALTLAPGCYSNMFEGCSQIPEAPHLPATKLVDRCYASMFYQCSTLENVTCLATTINGTDCTKDWLYEVKFPGTFTKAEGASCWSSGSNGIPFGWTVNVEYYNEVTLTDGSAITALNDYTEQEIWVNYTRSFTDGKTSTVCLPFAYTKKEGDGSFYAFTNIEKEGNEYVATMTEPVSTTLTANTPYLYLPNATGSVDFSGAYTIPADLTAGSTTSNGWTFKGTYSRLTYETTESNSNPFSGKVFGFAAYATEAGANNNASQEAVEAGEFVRATTGAYIRAFRAFLKYSGSDDTFKARGTRSGKTVVPEYITVRLIGKNGDVDAIGEISLSTGEVTFDSNAWYDLNGRKLNGVPTQKGIYIHKGKKVALH